MSPNLRTRHRFQPSVDSLEGRRLLAVTVSEFPIPSHSGAVVAGLDSAIWFPQDDGQLGRMSTAGELTSFAVGARPTEGLAVTSNGDVWFTTTDYQIGRFRPGGEKVLFDIAHDASSSAPWRLAAGPDGNIWFIEQSGNEIGRLTPEGSATEFKIPTERSLPAGICAGPDGNVWFTESNSNAIGRITPSGQITEFPGPSRPLTYHGGKSDVTGITMGPDGNLWFTEQDSGIGRITPTGQTTEFRLPSPTAQPYAITAGPDGNVWFTDLSANAIGRITPNGQVREFSIPTALSLPLGIAKGPDGNIWFGEKNKAQLGRLNVAYTDLAVAINAQPSPATVGKNLTYTVTVTNHGLNQATNVVVTDPLPLRMLSVVSVTSSQGTAQSLQRLEGTDLRTTIIAQLGTLVPGSAATVTIVFSPLKTGIMTNAVIVQADESELAAGHDSANTVTTVAASSTKPPPDGSTTPPAPIFRGEQRLYRGTGKRRKLVGFQLNFSGALDLISANTISHYQLTQPGRTNRSAPKLINIKSVKVSPKGLFVTLTPGKYDSTKPLWLTIRGLAGARHQSVATITTRL